MLVGMGCSDPAACCPFQEAKLQSVGFNHIHDCVRFFADRGANRIQANRTSTELHDDLEKSKAPLDEFYSQKQSRIKKILSQYNKVALLNSGLVFCRLTVALKRNYNFLRQDF